MEIEICPYCESELKGFDIYDPGCDELEECPECARFIYVEVEYEPTYYIKMAPTSKQIESIVSLLPKECEAKMLGAEICLNCPEEQVAPNLIISARRRSFSFIDLHISNSLKRVLGEELIAKIEQVLQSED